MRQLSNAEVKEKLFKILTVFADFCDKNKLQYYLCGGTLLGAVRHKDFIPWDDDIDVLMPRPDYIKLCELMRNKEIQQRYRLLSYEYGNLEYPISKFIDEELFVQSYYSNIDRYLWIDVFPMDGLPGNEEKDIAYLRKAGKAKFRFGLATTKLFSGSTKERIILSFPFKLFYHVIGRNKYAQQLDQMAKAYPFDYSDYIAGIAWANGPRERVTRSKFVPVIELDFHGRKFHAPAGYDEYLSSMYGDYMQIPPESKRENHRITVFGEE